jgi:uncharacterized repeat protein (TIGR04052 family)
MTPFFNPTLATSLIAAAVLTACGGGGTPAASTVSLSGVVADGYLTGAKVCLDKNDNSVCDAGEPFAMSIAGGKYTIDGLTAADIAAYPVVAEVPATATDTDLPGTVGKAFVLSTPKGNTTITPLSSLVHQELLATPALSAASAAVKVQTAMAITANPLADYIATPDADAHLKAQLLTQSVKTNSDAVGGGTAAERKKLQETLFALAKESVMANPPAKGASAPASVASAPAVGFEDFNTVRAVLANKLTIGTTASQAVAVNFDVVNGTTSVKACDSVTLPGLKLWDQTPLAASTPSAATPLATAAQTTQQVAGQMVDIRFFISNVLLWDAAGNAVPLVMTEDTNQSKNVALMDFGRNTAATGTPTCTSAYKTAITGKVVPGTYTAISFTLGVPVRSADLTTKLNHGAATPAQAASGVAAANPLPAMDTTIANNAGMQWAWQSGRKFTKIEFKTTTPANKFAAGVVGTNAVFNVHLGSTGCSGNPLTGLDTACTNPNRLGVKLAPFNAAADTVKLDLAGLFANVDATYEGGGAPGCMSGTTDPECPGIFKSLGLSLANGQTLTGAAVQTVFKK